MLPESLLAALEVLPDYDQASMRYLPMRKVEKGKLLTTILTAKPTITSVIPRITVNKPGRMVIAL
jgi:hypothetical protein